MLDEKDDTISRLGAKLRNAKEEAEVENKAKALQRITAREYFDEAEFLGMSNSVPHNSFSLVSRKYGGILLHRRTGDAKEKNAPITKLVSANGPPSPTAETSWSWQWPGPMRQVPAQDADRELGGQEREVLDQAGVARVEVQICGRMGGGQRTQAEQCDGLRADDDEECSVLSQGTSLTFGSSITWASEARPEKDQEWRSSDRVAADPALQNPAADPLIGVQEEPTGQGAGEGEETRGGDVTSAEAERAAADGDAGHAVYLSHGEAGRDRRAQYASPGKGGDDREAGDGGVK